MFRVVSPKNQRFFPNGYLKARVKPGDITEIPRWHPLRDKDGDPQVQMTDSEGNLLFRENRTPRGCEFLEFLDRTPRRPSQVQQEQASGSLKTKPKMRAADRPVGA